ncbi:unnamed protein product [Linum trigynum]|uniref:Uncharacterized protein n=1 Tax=Linum trigynum TaxID=586398 RepID=A0AAV2FV44_9ROSI
MSHHIGKDSCDSELKELEDKYYRRLKRGEYKTKRSDSNYRCPFCSGRRDYGFRELLRHADRVGRESQNRDLREKAQHLALSNYVDKYLRPKRVSHSSKHDSHRPLMSDDQGRERTPHPALPNSGDKYLLPKHVSDSSSKPDSHPPLSDDQGREEVRQLASPNDEDKAAKRKYVSDSASKCESGPAFRDHQDRERLHPPGSPNFVDKYARPKHVSDSSSKPDTHPPSSDDQGREKVQHLAPANYGDKISKPNHVSDSAGKADFRPPLKDDQGRFVWPCMGIVANIPTEVKDGRRVGESGSKLRDELTTKGYNPMRVHPLWNRMGHSGFAIVEFSKNWDGYKNALMFEKHFELERRGWADYHGRFRNRRGNELYGWFARDRDYYSREIYANYLKDKGDLRSVSDVTAENDRKDSKLFSSLKNTLEVKHENLKKMEEKYEDTKLSIEDVLSQKESMTSLYNEAISKMQQDVRNDFQKILLERERTKHDLEAQRRELHEREKHLHEREKHNEYEIQKLKREKEMNEKAILEQKKEEAKALKLAQEHQREKENLHKKIFELESQLDATQAVELEIEQLKGALLVLGHMDEDDTPESRKKKEEIREKLAEKEEELEDLEDLNQTLIIKHKKVEQELEEGRKELINGFLSSGTSGRANIGAKRSGGAKASSKGKRALLNEPAELWHFKEDREAAFTEGIDYIMKSWKRLKSAKSSNAFVFG